MIPKTSKRSNQTLTISLPKWKYDALMAIKRDKHVNISSVANQLLTNYFHLNETDTDGTKTN